ncbi:Hypothetical protein J6896_04488 [Nakaseomyces glabratus]
MPHFLLWGEKKKRDNCFWGYICNGFFSIQSHCNHLVSGNQLENPFSAVVCFFANSSASVRTYTYDPFVVPFISFVGTRRFLVFELAKLMKCSRLWNDFLRESLSSGVLIQI